MESKALWKKVSQRLEQILDAKTYKRWIQPIEVVRFEDGCFHLKAASGLYRYWLEDNYGELIRETMTSVHGKPLRFCFIPDDPWSEPTEKSDSHSSRPMVLPAPTKEKSMGLNPMFTFNSFIVGPSNQHAHAGCWAVAQHPGKSYNPLFIYGSTGLGKTHLMHAIGHHLAMQNKRTAYLSTERFVNDFIDAIQNNKLVSFRKRYRNCDVLLLDDVHFLGGKDKMQEEFFHTFNSLFNEQKQIVLSSDRPVSEISELQERLVSRFEWGLIVQIQQPDEETRLAILRRKQEQSEVEIQDEVLQYLARHVKTNIRRLEGAWAKVWFSSKLKMRSLTIDEVENELRDILIEESKHSLTSEEIQKRVAEYYDIRVADMTSKRRPASIAFPRQVAMYLCRTMTDSSLNDIGEAFGGRDHGTVLHACKLVDKRLKSEPSLKLVINQLSTRLTR